MWGMDSILTAVENVRILRNEPGNPFRINKSLKRKAKSDASYRKQTV